ncbi:adenylate/guanylate cyclase domain-containing protein [bacterium CPR1]|nr:adenylate/guanylate cyclase domain-containing protein [bacterium CPR1]
MGRPDESTVRTETRGRQGREWVRTGLDFVIVDPQGNERRVPLSFAQMNIGSPGAKDNDILLEGEEISNRQAILHFRDGQVFFTNLNTALPAVVAGSATTFRQLTPQDEIELGGFRLRIVELQDQVSFLEGYTDPYRDRQWGLGSEPTTIGRAGTRRNKVELEDPTVSRQHATIENVGGAFYLRPESKSGPTFVNGESIEGLRALVDGDLIQLGQQVLRFRSCRAAARTRALIPREATILFSDIWNYSTLAEGRPLEETIAQLNDFYRAMGKVILAHGGVLMTYLGDALMAVFGAEGPDEQAPRQAVSAGLEMHKVLEELNARYQAESVPLMRIGVGINTGEVMVGDVGFTGCREFAAVGDATNLAARIEKLTREFDVQVVITEWTEAAVRGHFVTRSLGSTQVKGRRAPVDLFEVVGPAESNGLS